MIRGRQRAADRSGSSKRELPPIAQRRSACSSPSVREGRKHPNNGRWLRSGPHDAGLIFRDAASRRSGLRLGGGGGPHLPCCAVAITARILFAECPRCEAGANERLRAGKVVDQFETLAARRRVGDHPVADLVRAISGAGEGLREKRCQPLLLPILEVLDAGVIELLI